MLALAFGLLDSPANARAEPPATPSPPVQVSAAPASSEHGPPLVVLDLESEDAEDQADALSAALRSRIRSTNDFTVVETTQHLSALMIALKCPQKPDATCLMLCGAMAPGNSS